MLESSLGANAECSDSILSGRLTLGPAESRVLRPDPLAHGLAAALSGIGRLQASRRSQRLCPLGIGDDHAITNRADIGADEVKLAIIDARRIAAPARRHPHSSSAQ
jgi:hypothetical protein